jgi:predicted ATPase
MLRELAEAVEVLAAERGLILWIEDLHWSDQATMDWLAFVARRRERARLLVLAAYRPVEIIVRAHPLKAIKQELTLHGFCEEFPLELLSQEAVGEYLAARFGGNAALPFPELARTIHRRTEGNPLFMINVIDYAVARGIIAEQSSGWQLNASVENLTSGVPTIVRELIDQELERLTPSEQRDFEAASIAGQMFSAAAVAAALETSLENVEERLIGAARRSLLVRESTAIEWPDGIIAGGYRFLHSIYREVLYERVPAARRAVLHFRIAQRLESAYGVRAKDVAAELADHFERARAYEPALKYLRDAAKNAGRRYAPHEAVELLRKGLKLLTTLPDTTDNVMKQLDLLITLGQPLMATKGQAAPELAEVYIRARELCLSLGANSKLVLALSGLHAFHLGRAELQKACELGGQLLVLAHQQDPALAAAAHLALGIPLFWKGEFSEAADQLEQAIALSKGTTMAFRAEQDPLVTLSYSAGCLWQLGFPDQALRRSDEAVAGAHEAGHPIKLAASLNFAAWLALLRREWRQVEESAAEATKISSEQGLPYWLAIGTILVGRGKVEEGSAEEGIRTIEQGIVDYRSTGAEIVRPFWMALLAESYAKAGRAEKGLSVLADALTLVHTTGEHCFEAELYRLTADLILQAEGEEFQPAFPKRRDSDLKYSKKAEASFLNAIEIAHRQGAKSLELRATICLSRLWQRHKRSEARRLLSEVYAWFTEGFETADLREAKLLLDQLSR